MVRLHLSVMNGVHAYPLTAYSLKPINHSSPVPLSILSLIRKAGQIQTTVSENKHYSPVPFFPFFPAKYPGASENYQGLPRRR